MNKDKHYWFNGISIESSPPAIVLDYSDPDQGGTILLFKYKIPFNLQENTLIELEYHYRHENTKSHKKMEIFETPKQIYSDTIEWIEKQLLNANTSKNLELYDNIKKIKDKLMKIVESI